MFATIRSYRSGTNLALLVAICSEKLEGQSHRPEKVDVIREESELKE